jgi:hypothetical protein
MDQFRKALNPKISDGAWMRDSGKTSPLAPKR